MHPLTSFLTSCESGRVFALTPISQVVGYSGLLVHVLFFGDFEGLGVLVVEWADDDDCLIPFKKASRVGKGGQTDQNHRS